jgi:chemotaxis response regulator CheB
MELLDKSCPDDQLRQRVIDLGDLVAGYDYPDSLIEPHAAAEQLRAPEARLVAIGASTGGPGAVATLLAALPRDFKTPVVVVQHMDEHFVEGFAVWLRAETGLPVRVAKPGDPLVQGEVLIAPPGVDTVFTRGLLAHVPPLKGAVHTPSVDAFFHSVALELGKSAVGVILSGMGDDGAAGLRAMKDRGAITFAQDAKSSVVHGMPGAAVRRGAVIHVGRPEEIGAQLGPTVARKGMSKQMMARRSTKRVLVVDDSQIVLDSIGATLEDAGYDVSKIDNPLTVAQYVRREAPDLVLIDVNMPAVSGDVVARIMRLSVGSPTKVALLSDLPDAELQTRAAQCGAVGYLRKTTDEDLLLAKVAELMTRPVPPK